MKKIVNPSNTIMSVCIIVLSYIIWSAIWGPGMGREVMIASAMVLSVAPTASIWLRFENSSSGTRMISLLAILVALNVCARQVMHGFGPTPIFFFTIITGHVLGPVPGFMHGSMTMLVSNFFVGGQGPWTPIQMAALGTVGWVSGHISCKNKWMLYPWGLLSGLLFGMITDISTWLFFTPAQTPGTYLAVAARGMPFNMAYGAGTVAFLTVMGSAMSNALKRFSKRLTVRIIRAYNPQRHTVNDGPAK